MVLVQEVGTFVWMEVNEGGEVDAEEENEGRVGHGGQLAEHEELCH